MSDHQDDTTPLEYFITGLVVLLFGLLYFFINHGTGFWSNPVDRSMLASAPAEVIPTQRVSSAGSATTPGPKEKKPELTGQDDESVVDEAELARKQAEAERLAAEEAAARKQAEAERLAAEEAARKQTETERLAAEETRKQAEADKLKAEEALRKQAEREQRKMQEALRKESEQARLVFKLPDGREVVIPDNGFEGLVKNAMIKQKTNEPYIFDGIAFESGSSKLNARSQDQIKAVAALMNTYKNIKIMIRGHTDNTGTLNANSLLSLTRSDSMKKALTELGIEQGRIKIEGVGQLEPIASNAKEEGRSRNRRIELILIE